MYNPQVSPVSSGLHALDRSSHGLLIHLQGDQTKSHGEEETLPSDEVDQRPCERDAQTQT